jgi:hypothetical protein
MTNVLNPVGKQAHDVHATGSNGQQHKSRSVNVTAGHSRMIASNLWWKKNACDVPHIQSEIGER